MGSVKRLEFDALPREGVWDYIYLNDDVQGSEGGRKQVGPLSTLPHDLNAVENK